MFNYLLLACLVSCVQCSVLVPTYVLPPSSFVKATRDQRSLPVTRTLARLAGGHIKLHGTRNNGTKGQPDHGKNTFAFVDKDAKEYEDKEAKYYEENGKKAVHVKDANNYDQKFAGVIVKTEGQNVGWNQGQWDDGMLMSSAGNGKEKNKQKAEVDEDKKTLADQVREGKYGLIQKELFEKVPSRPGVISYTATADDKTKDDESNLGGLKSAEDIWLSEDHLLVLRGGSYPEHGPRHGTDGEVWAPLDDFQAPPRQVKLPPNPEVPPPFPVRLSDGGPLVFLTPNGSVPAVPTGEGYGGLPDEGFPYPPASAYPPAGPHPGDAAPGGAPFRAPPGPLLPAGPFPGPLTGGPFPAVAFLPPPGNMTDLYDEDDPSNYYPPPYSFSYKADNSSAVPAGPLVPGIILPPPPDFFGPLEPDTPTTGSPATVLRPKPPQRPGPAYLPASTLPVVDSPDNDIDTLVPSTVPPAKPTVIIRPVQRKPDKVVVIPKPNPPRKLYTTSPPTVTKPSITVTRVEKKRPSVTIIQKPVKTTLKPVSDGLYDYPEKTNYLDGNSVSPSPQPFLVYGPPENADVQHLSENFVTSTPVPLRAYYSDPGYSDLLSQIQYTRQSSPNTRIRPEFYTPKQNGKSVASFYFYEEPIKQAQVSTPATQTYYDGRNYYQSVGENGQIIRDDYLYNSQNRGNFVPSSNVEFKPIPSREPSPFFYVPQRQGSRTLTQEYFSINQSPKAQSSYLPQQQTVPQQPQRPSGFYEQIANIQQTIDYFTTNRPQGKLYQPNQYREVRPRVKATQRPAPVYQYNNNYQQNSNPRPEQNTFRAPKMDDTEPFRPMVAYSIPYHYGSDFSTTPHTNLVDAQTITTAKPVDYDYGDISQKQTVERATARPSVFTPAPRIKSTKLRNSGPTTKNPVNHAYYTKQEENLFDDITKNYFTIFGQKIENGNKDEQGIAVTAPLRQIEASTIKTPINNGINIQYANEQISVHKGKPISLLSDTEVNYRQPRPLINPESEFIPIVNPQIQAKYEAEQQLKQIRDQLYHKQRAQNIEIIKSEPVPLQEGHQFARDQINYYRQQNQDANGAYSQRQVAEGRPGSLVAYRLPGEGAHVYFLTPQPARPENYKYRTAEEISTLS